LSRESQEIDAVHAARASDAAALAGERAQLAQLTGRLRELEQMISRQQELLAIDKDIRDVLGARNLRIIDVRDDGTPGRQRGLPGRVFYTEGKQLIFYAYDLQNKGNPAKVAFQAWGKGEGRSQPAVSLGVLYVDDVAQRRWMVKFEDPQVLAHIDQVFVTVEPPGGSARPTGKQLLFAAIPPQPNHP
jgi:hypothetical protein